MTFDWTIFASASVCSGVAMAAGMAIGRNIKVGHYRRLVNSSWMHARHYKEVATDYRKLCWIGDPAILQLQSDLTQARQEIQLLKNHLSPTVPPQGTVVAFPTSDGTHLNPPVAESSQAKATGF